MDWVDVEPVGPITRFWTDPVVGTGFNIGYDSQTLKRRSRGGGVESGDPDAHLGTYLFVVDPQDRSRDEEGEPLEPVAAWQNREYHQGQDIFAPRGARVPAYINGWIHRIGMERGAGGNVVTISTAPRNEDGSYPEGTEFVRYAHLDSVVSNIETGDYVLAGQIVGTVGDTGSARGTAPHIHLSVSVADSRGRFNWGERYHRDPYDLFDQSGWLTNRDQLYLSESDVYTAVRELFESVGKV
jgi:murein DD-endopeptidase MepM/ murein hydrolase activator NlpD